MHLCSKACLMAPKRGGGEMADRETDSKTEGETIMGCASAAGTGTHKGSFRGAIEILCNDLRTLVL